MNPLDLNVDDLGTQYPDLLAAVRKTGTIVSPRSMTTTEVSPLTLTLHHPERCVVQRPGMSKALMWMEITQLLAGEFYWELFEAISDKAAGLMDLHGAYGPRTYGQLDGVVAELYEHPESRRAVVYVGRDTDLMLVRGNQTQMPCTMIWQFMLRHEKLDMFVSMRSWDLVWGLSYDVPCFVAVQSAVASALGIEVGRYFHMAVSAHIYQRHWGMEWI